MSLDDLLKQIEEDEKADALELAREGQIVLTPIAYAKARGIRPQKVYSAIRNRKLAPERCPCGRLIVNIEAADTLFGFAKEVNDALDDSGSGEGR